MIEKIIIAAFLSLASYLWYQNSTIEKPLDWHEMREQGHRDYDAIIRITHSCSIFQRPPGYCYPNLEKFKEAIAKLMGERDSRICLKKHEIIFALLNISYKSKTCFKNQEYSDFIFRLFVDWINELDETNIHRAIYLEEIEMFKPSYNYSFLINLLRFSTYSDNPLKKCACKIFDLLCLKFRHSIDPNKNYKHTYCSCSTCSLENNNLFSQVLEGFDDLGGPDLEYFLFLFKDKINFNHVIKKPSTTAFDICSSRSKKLIQHSIMQFGRKLQSNLCILYKNDRLNNIHFYFE